MESEALCPDNLTMGLILKTTILAILAFFGTHVSASSATILMIGDSHTAAYGFGPEFVGLIHKKLNKDRFQTRIRVEARSGYTLGHWALPDGKTHQHVATMKVDEKTEINLPINRVSVSKMLNLKKLIQEQVDLKLLIFALGSNDSYEQFQTGLQKAFEVLKELKLSIPIVWVMPPIYTLGGKEKGLTHFSNLKKILPKYDYGYAMMDGTGSNDLFSEIDIKNDERAIYALPTHVILPLRPTKDVRGDGIHYNPEYNKIWARRMFSLDNGLPGPMSKALDYLF